MGVVLRVLVAANMLGLAAALLLAPGVADWPATSLDAAFRLEPVLILCVALLAAGARVLARLPSSLSHIVVIIGCGIVALLVEAIWRAFWLSDVDGVSAALRVFLVGAMVSTSILFYFGQRHRAGRPAVIEAQVAALTARIRPHFLFNSLNAVLSLIRKEPQRAEEALENLAELFRVLMRDPRDLVPLSEEIALCRQYLDLERLRLGERLRVNWLVGAIPTDALVPPLMLQPLIENAVYHGIEPIADGGELSIELAREDDRIAIRIDNPVGVGTAPHAGGNRMALDNIRQRLALHYDLEADLSCRAEGDRYHVTIRLPVRRRTPKESV
jgi:two-component system, LytTR family, sensor histidine kinase AlgZ